MRETKSLAILATKNVFNRTYERLHAKDDKKLNDEYLTITREE